MAMAERSIVGDLINFRGLVYAPLNEQGVVFLFGKVAHDLNMYVEEIKPGFPDCIGRRFVGKGWERVRIEFEFKSSNFQTHGHNPSECDIIVCWEHDWKTCPIEVIELGSEIRQLENSPIERPGALDPGVKDVVTRIATILTNVGARPEVKQWYETLFERVRDREPRVWAKVGDRYIGWYGPERSFASLILRKTSIQVDCFSGGLPLDGTTVSSARYAPRWAKFTIKSPADVEKARHILAESLARLRAAVSEGEATGYFSGGTSTSDYVPTPNGAASDEDTG